MTQLFYTLVKRSYQSLDRFYTPVKPTMFEINIGALVQRVGFLGCFKSIYRLNRRCLKLNVGAIDQ